MHRCCTDVENSPKTSGPVRLHPLPTHCRDHSGVLQDFLQVLKVNLEARSSGGGKVTCLGFPKPFVSLWL